jgi:hypothetical protein
VCRLQTGSSPAPRMPSPVARMWPGRGGSYRSGSDKRRGGDVGVVAAGVVGDVEQRRARPSLALPSRGSGGRFLIYAALLGRDKATEDLE